MSTTTPVHDERAEQAVLGAILTNSKCFADLRGLRSHHFFVPAHEVLFSTMQDMYALGEEIDTILLYARLREDAQLKRIGGAPYLATLLQAFKSAANVGEYAQIVIDQWKLRRVHELGVQFRAIESDPDEIPKALEDAREFLDGVDDTQDDVSLQLSELFSNWQQDQLAGEPPIETPWLLINDNLNGGLHRKRMYVVGARPGCGKTVMLVQMALYAAKLHKKALMFSLEMSKEDLMGRVLAAGAHVPYDEINKKLLSKETSQKIKQWTDAAKDLEFHVDDTEGLTIEEIAQRARIHQQRHGLDVVCIDYLQLVEESKGDSREQQVNHIAKRCRSIARRLNVVVIVAAQLNRKIEGADGKSRLPVKGDFRESGGIEQTADVALILHRPPDENGEETRLPRMSVTSVKNRQGTETTMTLSERFNQQRFDNLSSYQ